MRNIFKDKLILALTGVIVILLAGVIFLLFGGGQGVVVKKQSPTASSFAPTGDAKEETDKLLNEAKNIAIKEEGKPGPATEVVEVVREKNGTTTVEKAIVIGFESSPISMETGEVLTKDGERVVTNTAAGEPNGPRTSNPIDPSILPESTIKLTLSPTEITPKEFKVRAGQAVSIAFINTANTYAIFRFEDAGLSAVAVGLKEKQTRAMSFNAPSNPGKYVFFTEPNQAQGAVGKMIVE